MLFGLILVYKSLGGKYKSGKRKGIIWVILVIDVRM
jgi:hypothetical protein